MKYYNAELLKGLTKEQIEAAHAYQEEQKRLQNVIDYIDTEYNGPYSVEQLLSDQDFISRVADRSSAFNFDCECVKMAIDDVFNYEHYIPKPTPKRLYIDMDGVLANFAEQPKYLERMFEKGFFSELSPYEKAVDAVNRLAATDDIEVYILSACIDGEPPHCQIEKNEWIDRYLPNIDAEHRIFLPMGQNKAELIQPISTDILWDDYNVNLLQWREAGGVAVKCLNDMNGKGLKGPHFYGASVSNQSYDIYEELHAMLYSNGTSETLDLTAEQDIGRK